MACDLAIAVGSRSNSMGPARAILTILALHADPDGTIRRSVAELADDGGVNRTTVLRALAQLEAIGEIARLGVSNRCAVYRITLPDVRSVAERDRSRLEQSRRATDQPTSSRGARPIEVTSVAESDQSEVDPLSAPCPPPPLSPQTPYTPPPPDPHLSPDPVERARPSIDAEPVKVDPTKRNGHANGTKPHAFPTRAVLPEGFSLTPPPADPKKRKRKASASKPDPVIDSEFPDWWAVYPRHKGRAMAEIAYREARQVASERMLMDGAKRYAAEMAGKEAQFVAHATTWLHQRRWLDEPDWKVVGDGEGTHGNGHGGGNGFHRNGHGRQRDDRSSPGGVVGALHAVLARQARKAGAG